MSQQNWMAAEANDVGPGWIVRRDDLPTLGYDHESAEGRLSEEDARSLAQHPQMVVLLHRISVSTPCGPESAFFILRARAILEKIRPGGQ